MSGAMVTLTDIIGLVAVNTLPKLFSNSRLHEIVLLPSGVLSTISDQMRYFKQLVASCTSATFTILTSDMFSAYLW